MATAVLAGAFFLKSELALNSFAQVIGFGSAGLVYSTLMASGTGVGFNNESRAENLQYFLLGGVAITLMFSPVMDLSYRLNEWLLVEGSALHTFAAEFEEQAAKLTKDMLVMDTPLQFILALTGVAVVPAVFEEYLFRGTLQPLFAKWFGNIHVSIWVTAALFSLFHFQFFGFLPRMLLGAVFGYLVVWSGSIYPAILAHFLNNGVAVAAAYLMGGEWIEETLNPAIQSWETVDYVVAAVCITGVMLVGKRLMDRSVWSENKAKYLARVQ